MLFFNMKHTQKKYEALSSRSGIYQLKNQTEFILKWVLSVFYIILLNHIKTYSLLFISQLLQDPIPFLHFYSTFFY